MEDSVVNKRHTKCDDSNYYNHDLNRVIKGSIFTQIVNDKVGDLAGDNACKIPYHNTGWKELFGNACWRDLIET